MDKAGADIGGDMRTRQERHFEFIAQAAKGWTATRMPRFALLHRAHARDHHLGLFGHVLGEKIGQQDQFARPAPAAVGGIGDPQ